MATEGPTFRDGSQCQAAANYWNPATKLFGPGGSGQFLGVTLTAARVVTLITAATQAPYGILQNSPDQGQAADVCLFGITKAVNGVAGALAAGALLMADANGRMIVYTGAGNICMGYAVEAAAAQNTIFTMFVFPSAVVHA